jgi:Protein involved in catabolism of external DNA
VHYRHAYHAGNFADVFKHLILVALLRRLSDKPAPWAMLDSHAGAGLYTLDGGVDGVAGEWRDGVGRLWGAPVTSVALADWQALLTAANPGGALRFYPGSPWLARRGAREDDRIVACEAVAEVADQLRARVPGLELHRRNGYELASLLPPRERRGLLLIDPPFERADEFDAMAAFVDQARQRFAGGVYALWYPLKNRHAAARFVRRTARGVEALECGLDTGAAGDGRMRACAMLILNPPWGIEATLAPALEELARLLARGPAAESWVEPIRPEASMTQR